ncbi:delta-1-pyrroline-5-carboxylate dehydrogenase, mitochondrial [Lucilia sericata]|uniref:delta-1-pyrroline-5-carboxylate dehydrogenase, mitochondrial n=1 Tax=Lucilia sericata TaxID=13632 RepID=UPI0018A8535B|nr:delta-1-pyrroline-5-carboxylate dehydrogenase, mitochondrial [Lucilia sericata]XP_037810924.1 delta-1-pyrroline-5-carboxylate dehydrogenase, mitochondrial [Lucilia sericata]
MFSKSSFIIVRRFSTKIAQKDAKPSLTSSVVAVKRFDHINYKNEPILEYKPGSEELINLEKSLEHYSCNIEEIPIVIGGKEIKTNQERCQRMPHKHKNIIAKYYYADQNIINQAIRTSKEVKEDWDNTPYEKRLEYWEKAACLMATKYRADLVAATMLGQAKTVYQAEIDAAAELIDFTRLSAEYLKELVNYEPLNPNAKIYKNHMIWRGLDGFVAAISPFNFTAIGGNLAFTPALMGNVVLWKPADNAMLSSWLVFKIMREAGLPEGVVNFIPADGPMFGNTVTYSQNLAGINFTGSITVFRSLWKLVAKYLDFHKTYPRLSGECGGKNYHFVHPSADVDTVVACTLRSAFEYSGQKCSACSRLYVPDSLWESKIKKPLCDLTRQLLIGDVCDYKSFTSAVINEKAFLRINDYLDYAKTNSQCDVLVGGRCSNLHGFFIEPTIVEVRDPEDRLFKEEIFGPLLSVFVYKEKNIDKTLELVRNTPKYALTGAVFATDKQFIKEALRKFKCTAGNFYINDKSTGAVVGQQAFGGGKLSGTNDKPGSPYYLLRWTSPQTIKETFVPQTDVFYPYMGMDKT